MSMHDDKMAPVTSNKLSVAAAPKNLRDDPTATKVHDRQDRQRGGGAQGNRGGGGTEKATEGGT